RVALLEGGAGRARFRFQVVWASAPGLGQTGAGAEGALEQLGGDAAGGGTMDGPPNQRHKAGELVRVLTRNANGVPAAIPEIAVLVRELPASQLILAGEAITSTRTRRPHSARTTMRRVGRKPDVAELRAGLPTRAYFFDCLC